MNGNVPPLKDDYNHKRSLSQCVIKAVNCCVATGEVATLSVSNVEEDADVLQFEDILLEDLAKTDKISYVIKKASTKKKVHNYKQRIGIYIIYMKNARDLYQSLTSLSSEEDFNAHAKFLIVSTTKINNSTITETYIANIIWSFNLLNVVGLIPEEGKSETYQVYTSHYHGVCGYSIAAKITDKCVNGISGKNWFDDNTPKNLEGCQFDVRTSIIEPFVMYHDNLTNPQNGYNLTAGLEIKLLNAVAEYVNLTLNYTITRSDDVYGQFYPNSSFDGSYLDLSERKIDLIVGYVVSRPETQEIFDTISSYFQDSLVICIAHAKMVEDWNKVTKIMLSRVIVYYMIAWLVLSVFMYSLARIKQGEILYYRSYDNNLLSAVKIAYGISITTLPITTICRFLLLLWIIFGFFYRSIYITYGIKSLSITEWDYQIHTEQELMSKNILYYPICLNYYSKEEVSQVKVELCENYTKCLSMTVESDKYATCTPKLNVQYLFRKFLDDKGYPRLYCLNKDVVTFPLEMLMWKGHPLKPRINELVKRLSAGGFISKWHKEIFENLLIHSKANTFVSSEELVLKISHLSQPFVIVIISHFVAIIVFIIEMYLFRRMNNH